MENTSSNLSIFDLARNTVSPLYKSQESVHQLILSFVVVTFYPPTPQPRTHTACVSSAGSTSPNRPNPGCREGEGNVLSLSPSPELGALCVLPGVHG